MARLFAKGFKQKYCIDYTETFSQGVKNVMRHMVIALTKYFNWTLDLLDLVTAFLFVEIKNIVFCAVPESVDVDKDFSCFKLIVFINCVKSLQIFLWKELCVYK